MGSTINHRKNLFVAALVAVVAVCALYTMTTILITPRAKISGKRASLPYGRQFALSTTQRLLTSNLTLKDVFVKKYGIKNIKKLEAAIAELPEFAKQKGAPIKPSSRWLMRVKPSSIHTKLRVPQRNVIFFSNIMSYIKWNFSATEKTGIPREKMTFSKEILWPVYSKYKRINIIYIVTASFFEYRGGHYYSKANKQGWDPQHVTSEQIDTADFESRAQWIDHMSTYMIAYKDLFTLPHFSNDGNAHTMKDIEAGKKHNYPCKIFPVHLSAGQEWENPDNKADDSIQSMRRKFGEALKHKDPPLGGFTQKEADLHVVEPGKKSASYWKQFFNEFETNIIIMEGGQTHWLNRQLREHGLYDYLRSDAAKDMILSGASAGIINTGVSNAVAAYKCFYHSFQYQGCDFIRDGEPQSGRGSYCIPMKYDVGIFKNKYGEERKADYSSQTETLKDCMMDGLNAYPGIIFPHMPNVNNDKPMNILSDVYEEESDLAFGVVVNHDIARMDNDNSIYGETLVLTDGEAGAIGPLFDKKKRKIPHFVRLPLAETLDENEIKDTVDKLWPYWQANGGKEATWKDSVKSFYARMKEVRYVSDYQETSVQKVVRLIEDLKTRSY